MDVLLSFVGNRDPYVEGSQELGPVLSLLKYRPFSRVFLFCTGPDYFERAKTVEEIATSEYGASGFNFIDLELESVIDYEEIYAKLDSVIAETLNRVGHASRDISILLDPGTPQMQTCWVLLVRSGRLDARLLQGIPPRFAGGAYKAKEVALDGGVLPDVLATPLPAPEAAREPAPGYAPPSGEWIRPTETRGIIGDSPAFNTTLELAHRCAGYDVSVLIRGETGSGKELIAKSIHEMSPRAGNPFLPVNCASIGATMAESELFGHVKGAYTGASSERLGKFRTANAGTIFLDEVGDLPLEVQPKLLRVLQDGTLTPLGGDKEFEVDVRVIAATNRDLEALIADGSFRRDLYERLAQTVVTVPPLKDRRDDIAVLASVFLTRWNDRYHESKGLSEETMKYLIDYPWPGNVRELENAISSLCATGQSGSIGPELLPKPILAHFKQTRSVADVEITIPEDGMDLAAYLFQIERGFCLEALERANGNRAEAAKLLNLNAPAYRKALRERFGLGEDRE